LAGRTFVLLSGRRSLKSLLAGLRATIIPPHSSPINFRLACRKGLGDVTVTTEEDIEKVLAYYRNYKDSWEKIKMNLARPMIMATAAAMLLGSMLGISFPLMGQKNNTSGNNSASLIQNQFAQNQVAQNPSSSSTKTTTTQTTPTQSTTTQTKTTTTKRPVQALW
jgi:hypothetical protein